VTERKKDPTKRTDLNRTEQNGRSMSVLSPQDASGHGPKYARYRRALSSDPGAGPVSSSQLIIISYWFAFFDCSGLCHHFCTFPSAELSLPHRTPAQLGVCWTWVGDENQLLTGPGNGKWEMENGNPGLNAFTYGYINGGQIIQSVKRSLSMHTHFCFSFGAF